MALNVWGLICTPAVVHARYFDYDMKATIWKVKVVNMFAMLIIWCKMHKKDYCKLQFLGENKAN